MRKSLYSTSTTLILLATLHFGFHPRYPHHVSWRSPVNSYLPTPSVLVSAFILLNLYLALRTIYWNILFSPQQLSSFGLEATLSLLTFQSTLLFITSSHSLDYSINVEVIQGFAMGMFSFFPHPLPLKISNIPMNSAILSIFLPAQLFLRNFRSLFPASQILTNFV